MVDTVDKVDRVEQGRRLDRDTSRGKRIFRPGKPAAKQTDSEIDEVEISSEARERAAGKRKRTILEYLEETE